MVYNGFKEEIKSTPLSIIRIGCSMFEGKLELCRQSFIGLCPDSSSKSIFQYVDSKFGFNIRIKDPA